MIAETEKLEWHGEPLRAGDFDDDRGWHGFNGGMVRATRSGVQMDEREAMSLPAALAATRIIAETIASLPCRMKELVDERTTRDAVNRPEYNVLAMQPNPEMDRFTLWDMQLPHTMNWGNAFAEKQKDANGRVTQLWPIHPCRIPPGNIVRQGQGRGRAIKTGQDGDIWYLVRNDDGSESPIRRDDMLHIVGVQPEHGLYGRSLIEWGAEAMGVGVATQRHVGAFYRNGGSPDIVLKFPGPLKREKKLELRQSWIQMHQGADNAHRMMVVDNGGDVQVPSFSPEAQQLLDARKFTVHDIARIYRVPVSMLASVETAPRANVEQENLSFVRDTIRPWLSRLEMALRVQLLPLVSRSRFEFRFDLSELGRGDMAARAQFYETLQKLGAYSPNDIRNAEDMNPVDGGDRYFIMGNNLVPLDRVDELATLNAQDAPQGDDMPDDAESETEPEGDDEAALQVKQYEDNALRQMKLRSMEPSSMKSYSVRVLEFYAEDGKFVRAATKEYGCPERAEAHRVESLKRLNHEPS